MGKFLKWKDPKEGQKGLSQDPALSNARVWACPHIPGGDALQRWGFLFLLHPSLTICPPAGLSILARPDLQRNREWFWRLAQGELLMA